MKTPRLFDIPQGPSAKDKLDAFKSANQIESRNCGTGYKRGEGKWMALHLPTGRRVGSGYGVSDTADLVECAMKVSSLLEDAGYVGYGDTELESVREAAKAVGIVFQL